jgi:hypothetical protein
MTKRNISFGHSITCNLKKDGLLLWVARVLPDRNFMIDEHAAVSSSQTCFYFKELRSGCQKCPLILFQNGTGFGWLCFIMKQ